LRSSLSKIHTWGSSRRAAWRIGKTLAGETVMIQPIEDRFLVYFCNTLVREIDPSIQRSTIVERWIETPL
jgi:hypothetical protein